MKSFLLSERLYLLLETLDIPSACLFRLYLGLELATLLLTKVSSQWATCLRNFFSRDWLRDRIVLHAKR